MSNCNTYLQLENLFHIVDKDHAHIAHLIERDLKIVLSDEITLPLPPNNENQQEAINKALDSRFSLIQGPPGKQIFLIFIYSYIQSLCQYNVSL